MWEKVCTIGGGLGKKEVCTIWNGWMDVTVMDGCNRDGWMDVTVMDGWMRGCVNGWIGMDGWISGKLG